MQQPPGAEHTIAEAEGLAMGSFQRLPMRLSGVLTTEEGKTE
jgi:hypothetical protein